MEPWPYTVGLPALEVLFGVDLPVSASLQPILVLLGFPVAGNPTQYMIEKAFAHREMDWRYLSVEVSPEDLSDAVRGVKVMGFCGGNCADPHKSRIVPFLDRTGDTAELSGLVNCMRRDNGQLIGENTEGSAIVEAIRLRLDPAGRRVTLLGAGDLARAVAVELALAKVAEIRIAAPDEPAAHDLVRLLAERLQIAAELVPWQEPFVLTPETEVVIHATGIGAGEAEEKFPLDLDSLTPEMLVVDTVANPPETWLIREAEHRGCATIDGLEILIGQAAINFKLWTGVDPDTSVMREAVEEFLEL